jgi:hypothetical protein
MGSDEILIKWGLIEGPKVFGVIPLKGIIGPPPFLSYLLFLALRRVFLLCNIPYAASPSSENNREDQSLTGNSKNYEP